MIRMLSLLVTSVACLLSGFAVADDAKFTPLFDGKSLAGWKTIGDGTWKVAGGVIHGSSDTSQKRHGYLYTVKQYGDFVVRLEFKTASGDSGLYFRVERKDNELIGMQANIDPRGDTGGLYEIGGRKWVVRPKAEAVKKYFRPGEWNEMIVTARGRHITVRVNGILAAEVENDTGRTRGQIAKQKVDVQFKDVELAK
ncbi:MAG: DUF1080 domain-containing protein [Planctomycetes bacterium]|nr:DUF1080 domain-containing protein [Planctomycetota bacterium]